MNKGLMNKKSNIMENVIKFDTLTVVGSTKEEALESAPFAMQGEATRSYKKWEASQTGAITDKMKDEFFLTFLKKNTKCQILAPLVRGKKGEREGDAYIFLFRLFLCIS